MALETYKQKRHFAKTPEPHDFRLEADGVLKSWAIPKQPTLDSKVKRLAVRVEDHPLAYANFSREIPEGEYGAGLVTIWDQGTYENLLAQKPQPQTIAQGIESGHIEAQLHGAKLKGNFALIRLPRRGGKHEHWLLVKMQDAEARLGTAASNHSPVAPPAKPAQGRPAAPRPRRTNTRQPRTALA